MKPCPLAIAFMMGIPCSVLAAGLDVRLEKIAEATAPTTLGSPVVSGGGAFYYGASGGPTPGLFMNGGLVLASGGMISGNEVNNIGPTGSDSSSVLVGASSNHATPSPDNFSATLNVIDGVGAPSRILSRGTALPGYPDPPHPGAPIGPGNIHGGQVAFLIREYNTSTPRLPTALAVIPAAGGTVSVIVREGDTVPNGGGTFSKFDSFNIPWIHNGAVVFYGRSLSRSGIYEWSGGSLSVVVDSTTARPGGGTFSGTFGVEPVKDGQDYAFIYSSALYQKKSGMFSLVANSSTPVPGGTGNLATYTSQSLRNGRLIFHGTRSASPSEFGIYLHTDSGITPIVDTRTDFATPGKVPVSYGLARSGAWVNDSAIAFRVTFSDNSTAIYKATFQPASGEFTGRVVFTGPRTGTITVTSKSGHTYALLRTTTLTAGDQEQISSQAGTGNDLVFPFDDTARLDKKAFFRVRETKN